MKTKYRSTALSFWDETSSRKHLAIKNRDHLATKGVLDGWNAEDLRIALEAFAHEQKAKGGDDNPLYFVSKMQARRLLDRARWGLARDLSSSRLAEYAKFIGRLEEMYKRAIAAGNDRMALEVTRIEIDLSNLLHGLSIGQSGLTKQIGASKALDQAIAGLTQALAGRHTPACREDSLRDSGDEIGPVL